MFCLVFLKTITLHENCIGSVIIQTITNHNKKLYFMFYIQNFEFQIVHVEACVSGPTNR